MGVPFDEQPENNIQHVENEESSSEESESQSETTSDGSDESNDDEFGREGYEFSDDGSEEEFIDPSEGGILTLILRAAECGDSAELTQLIPSLSVSVDTPGIDGDTALHLSALYGHIDCTRVLLDHGALANIPDEDGAVPLHDAAAGGYVELAELLLEKSPDSLNVLDSDGDSPLHNAARGGSIEMVQLLLEKGANPTLRNNDFSSPAMMATSGEMASMLTAAENEWHNRELAAREQPES